MGTTTESTSVTSVMQHRLSFHFLWGRIIQRRQASGNLFVVGIQVARFHRQSPSTLSSAQTVLCSDVSQHRRIYSPERFRLWILHLSIIGRQSGKAGAVVKTRVQLIQKLTGNCSLRTRSFLLKSLGWFCPTLEWLPPHVSHDPKMDARVPLHQHLYGGYHLFLWGVGVPHPRMSWTTSGISFWPVKGRIRKAGIFDTGYGVQ